MYKRQLVNYADGEKRYILAPLDLKVGDVIESGPDADIKIGNCPVSYTHLMFFFNFTKAKLNSIITVCFFGFILKLTAD